MIRAAGILGSNASVIKLRGSLRSRRVSLERINFRFTDELVGYLNENPDTEAVLISELGIKQNHTNFEDELVALRNMDPTVRIIIIMEGTDRNTDFELWCYHHAIYDVFYPNRHTDVDIDAIGSAVCMGRIDPDNPPPPPKTPETQDKRRLLNRFKGFSFPELKLPDLPAFKRKKRDYLPNPTADTDIHTIGIINSSRGFGATTLTVSMASCLFDAGYSVSALAMDLKPDLFYADLSGVTVSVPDADTPPDWVTLAASSDFLIIDFGIVYEYLPSGEYMPAQSRAEEARAVKEALDFCDLHLCIASEEPWHKMKTTGFLSEDKATFILPREADASAILHTLGVL
jgi:hypothetical protein